MWRPRAPISQAGSPSLLRGLPGTPQFRDAVERDHGSLHPLHRSAGHQYRTFREDQLSPEPPPCPAPQLARGTRQPLRACFDRMWRPVVAQPVAAPRPRCDAQRSAEEQRTPIAWSPWQGGQQGRQPFHQIQGLARAGDRSRPLVFPLVARWFAPSGWRAARRRTGPRETHPSPRQTGGGTSGCRSYPP